MKREMMTFYNIKIQKNPLHLGYRLFREVQIVLFLSLSLLLVGCAVKPEPLTNLELDNSADTDHIKMFSVGERITGELSLEEAIARALKYNLDKRTRIMEHALAVNQIKLDEYSLLPKLVAKRL